MMPNKSLHGIFEPCGFKNHKRGRPTLALLLTTVPHVAATLHKAARDHSAGCAHLITLGVV